jgi:hypothetical protein
VSTPDEVLVSEGEFHSEAMVQLSKKETTLGLLLRSIVGPEKGWLICSANINETNMLGRRLSVAPIMDREESFFEIK